MPTGAMRLRLSPRIVVLALAFLLRPVAALGAHAADSPWWSVTAENDNFVVDQDEHYVNGLNLDYLSPSLSKDDNWAAAQSSRIENGLPLLFPRAEQFRDRRFEWTVLGQQIFTPANKNLATPDPSDRPYAAWLYSGFSLLQSTDRRQLDRLAATIGVVGPAALGEEVQNSFHRIFGFGNAQGWSHQLKNEPALTIGYQRKWRFAARGVASDGFNADVVPELGATAGNVITSGEATALVRAGWGLNSSYGPQLIETGLPGNSYFNPDDIHRDWTIYAFAGFQQQAVAHNIFLDGNSYQSSPAVAKYTWVHNEAVGLSAVGWRRVRVDFTYVRRSEEFHGQDGDNRYGSITVAVPW